MHILSFCMNLQKTFSVVVVVARRRSFFCVWIFFTLVSHWIISEIGTIMADTLAEREWERARMWKKRTQNYIIECRTYEMAVCSIAPDETAPAL